MQLSDFSVFHKHTPARQMSSKYDSCADVRADPCEERAVASTETACLLKNNEPLLGDGAPSTNVAGGRRPIEGQSCEEACQWRIVLRHRWHLTIVVGALIAVVVVLVVTVVVLTAVVVVTVLVAAVVAVAAVVLVAAWAESSSSS